MYVQAFGNMFIYSQYELNGQKTQGIFLLLLNTREKNIKPYNNAKLMNNRLQVYRTFGLIHKLLISSYPVFFKTKDIGCVFYPYSLNRLENMIEPDFVGQILSDYLKIVLKLLC